MGLGNLDLPPPSPLLSDRLAGYASLEDMRHHPSLWVLRGLWITVPFPTSIAVADAFADSSDAVRLIASIAVWVVWGLVLAALAVPHPISLTAIRLLVPLYVAHVVAIAIRAQTAAAIAAAAIATLALVVALTRWIADACANGAAYGEERRFTLRAPAAVLVGAAPLAWMIAATTITAGPLLIAAGHPVWGGAVTVLAPGAWYLTARSFHTLSTRWLVVVPAGITIVDPMTLIDAVLVPTRAIASFEPALIDTDATDLSLGALGLALEIRSHTPLQLTRRSGRRDGELVTADAIVITPADPAGALTSVHERLSGRR